ncbi:amidohydrolase [bacterium]|nr:amidohydrolase [candidate division CSSED10-310 bacterium]
MRGRFLVPGFTDSHLHLVAYAIAQSRLHLDGLDEEQIRHIIGNTAGRLAPGQWIRGRGWEAAHRKKGGFPDRMEIDDVTLQHPTALFSKDGHSLWLNSAALGVLQLTHDVTDPPGGRYERRLDGSLTGLMRETAADVVRNLLPAVTDTEKRHLLQEAFPRLHAQGIIAVHSFEGLDEFELLCDMDDCGDLPLKVTAYVNLEDFDRALAIGVVRGTGSPRVNIGGLKLYADGALGSRTASVFVPYSDDPVNVGMDVMDAKNLRIEAVRAAEHGLPTAIHAIGDRAVRYALDALIAARETAPNIPGMRIEHLQLVQPVDLPRFAASGITASIQPCHLISDMAMARTYWANQTGLLYPYGSIVASGAHYVMGSDAPIDRENPLHNISCAVSRRRTTNSGCEAAWIPEECMTAVSALRGCTIFPADLEFRRRGRIAPGYPADYVVLDTDPLAPNAFEPGQLQIMTTVLDGDIVFSA